MPEFLPACGRPQIDELASSVVVSIRTRSNYALHILGTVFSMLDSILTDDVSHTTCMAHSLWRVTLLFRADYLLHCSAALVDIIQAFFAGEVIPLSWVNFAGLYLLCHSTCTLICPALPDACSKCQFRVCQKEFCKVSLRTTSTQSCFSPTDLGDFRSCLSWPVSSLQ